MAWRAHEAAGWAVAAQARRIPATTVRDLLTDAHLLVFDKTVDDNDDCRITLAYVRDATRPAGCCGTATISRLPANPPTLHTEPAARARRAELQRLRKTELATLVCRGVRRPDGSIATVIGGDPGRWRKDELITHIVHLERPDLPWAMTPYNQGRLDQMRGTVDTARLVEPDYKLGVAHAAELGGAGRTAQRTVFAAGEPWLRASTWYRHWRAWLTAAGENDRDEDELDRALAILIENQAAWLTQYLPPGCRWDVFADELVGPAGTVLPADLAQTMREVAAGVERAGHELLEELFADAQ